MEEDGGFDGMTCAELFALKDESCGTNGGDTFVASAGVSRMPHCSSSPPRLTDRPTQLLSGRPVPTVAVLEDMVVGQPSSQQQHNAMPHVHLVHRTRSAGSALTERTNTFELHDSRPKPKLFPRRE